MYRHAHLVALALLISTGLLLPAASVARDTLHTYSVSEALKRGFAEGVLLDKVRLYFAGQEHPAVSRDFGEFRTNKKTNAFNKSDKVACEWAFFSALKQLQERARDLGGDAVINIKSNYKNREFVSATEFQCGAGNVIAGVALKGSVVKLE